jgi:hypothetical protein
MSFRFVDKRFEISNLELIRDMVRIIKSEELLSIGKEKDLFITFQTLDQKSLSSSFGRATKLSQ